MAENSMDLIYKPVPREYKRDRERRRERGAGREGSRKEEIIPVSSLSFPDVRILSSL